MTRRSTAAFHQLPEGCVRATAWRHDLNGEAKGDTGALLPDWDYLSTLLLKRSLTLDWGAAQEALDLAGPFDLELVVELGTGRGNPWREILMAERTPLPHGTPVQEIVIEAPSRLISHQLSVRTSLLLLKAGVLGSTLSPSEAGSRLWADRLTTRLEGDDPRFPMEVLDFAAHFAGRHHRHAPWFVNWSPAGAHRDFRGAIRLYLNAGQPGVVERVQAQDPLILQAIMSDVISQVCEGMLRNADHPSDLDDAEEGTLADQARHWLERAFVSVDEARSMLEQRPGEFRAALLASVRFEG